MGLTKKQRRFCDEFIANGGNATQAAISAGYSRKTAGQIGDQNLKKLEIEKYIRERTEEADANLVAKGDEVLRYITSVMRGEDEEQRVLVADGIVGVESYVDQRNRLKAAEMLAKCHGLMTQNVNHGGGVSISFVDDLAEEDGT